MSNHSNNNYPRLHNAMWPGLVGKGSPGAEPFIDLDTMLDLTAKAEVDGIKFDGVDIFLFESGKGRRQNSRERIRRWLGGCAGLAADRWRLGHGQCGGAEKICRAGPQRVSNCRETERTGRSSLRSGSH